MSRYSLPQPTPPSPTMEGDSSFTAVNMKLERSALAAGTLALAINKRLRKGVAETRRGTFPPIHFNAPDLIGTMGAIRGAGVYSNPNGDEVLLVATADNHVYAMADGSYPHDVGVAPGITFAGPVEFVQAFDKVLLFRGLENAPLVWDGVSSAGFAAISKKDPADTSTVIIPGAVTAEPFVNRLLIATDRDNVLVSDIGDYTSYDKILDAFRLNAGTSDTIVRLFGYALGGVLVFKGRSIMSLSNFTNDPTQANISVINSQLGLAARKAVVWDGGDVLFLSEPGGIYRLGQVIQDRIQAAPLPVSDNIEPLIARINWSAFRDSGATGGRSAAVAERLGEYIYFAVPIDGATRPNAMIVYNSARQQIEGYDTWPEPFRIDELKVTLFQGERRLFAIDKELGRIYVMYEGRSDFIFADSVATAAQEHEISDLIETRGYAPSLGYNYGYGLNTSTLHDFGRAEIACATWAPSIKVTQLTERAGDERPLNVTPITKSRTVYDRFAVKDWDPTNANGDWDTPGRQDYSIVADDAGIDPGAAGIDPERKQNTVLRFSTKARARYMSYRIENSQGSCDVSAVLVESAGVPRTIRRAA